MFDLLQSFLLPLKIKIIRYHISIFDASPAQMIK